MPMQPADIAFIIVAALCLSGALFMLLAKDVLYAALGLLAVLLGVAGLFFLAGAEFLAVSQIMVYAGGVIILILFGVMITNGSKIAVFQKICKHRLAQLFIVLGLYFIFSFLALQVWDPKLVVEIRQLRIREIGFLLLTKYLLPFEFSIVLLLAALVGASVVAVKK